MSGAIVRTKSPEEREYANYAAEIEVRKQRLAELQADIQRLKGVLDRFNAEYLTRVGVLFVRLDKIRLSVREYEFRIASLQSNPERQQLDQMERETRDRFTEEQGNLHHAEEETRRYESTHRENQQLPKLDEQSEARLKSLFRELAKRFHPDLARTDMERRQCEAIMKRVNAAFHARNIGLLEKIGLEGAIADPKFETRSIAEKLVWATREVSRFDAMIVSLVEERDRLLTSDLAELWRRQQAGEDVIGQLESVTKRDLDHAQQQLQKVIEQFRQATHVIVYGR